MSLKSLKAFGAAFLAAAEDDVVLDFLPLFNTAVQSAASAVATGNRLGAVAAVSNLQVQVLAQVPTLAGQLASLLAGAVNTVTNEAVAAATAKVATDTAAVTGTGVAQSGVSFVSSVP